MTECEYMVIDKAIGYAYAIFDEKVKAMEWVMKSGRPHFFKIIEFYGDVVVWGGKDQ